MEETQGQTWLHWIVHEKWPVYCANLMSSVLLVIEIHAIKKEKVLLRIYLDLEEWLKMAVLHGLESNGGVMASQWYTTTNFHKLYPMMKTASLHSF